MVPVSADDIGPSSPVAEVVAGVVRRPFAPGTSSRTRRRRAPGDVRLWSCGHEEHIVQRCGIRVSPQAARDGVATEVALQAVDALHYANGELDPHFWQDPVQAAAVAAAVGRRLAGLDPAHAEAYRRAAAAFGVRLARLTKEATAIYASVPRGRRALVSNHDAYRYLARRFGFDVLGSIVPGRSTAAVPSPSHLADLAAAMRQRGACVVFTEEGGSSALAASLAREVGPGVAVVALYAGTLPEGGYPAMVRANAERITNALERCP